MLIMTVVVTGAGFPAAVSFAYEGTVELSTPEDLVKLSEESINESATVSVNFVLVNDIDLTDTDFKPISLFAGTLDGKGHSIKGFSFRDKGDRTGFIRTVTASGTVKNLKVEGAVTPLGEMSEVGGIAGENSGRIENCSFKGFILGQEIVGGIVGHNKEQGIIKGCINSASVNATKRTGGIAGFNEGIIESSENRGEINAARKTASEMDEDRGKDEEESFYEEEAENGFDRVIFDTFDLKDDDILKKLDNGLKINYTGGITGVCSGTVRDCLNSGTVGYPHSGYKTGGITGYDRGIVTGCMNTALVFGRKDVGGIAGQFEPVVKNIYSKDALSEAGDALDQLTDLTEKLHKDIGSEDDRTQGNIDAIRNSSDELRQVIKEYKEYYRCKDDSVEREIRNQTENIRRILDEMEIKGYDSETKGALNALNDNTDKISALLDGAGSAAESGVSVDMTGLFLKISDILATNNAAFDTLLEKAVKANKDGHGLKKDLEELRGASNDLDDYLRGCVDDYKKDLRITGDDLESRTDRIADQADILSEGLKESDSAIRKDLDRVVESLNSLNVSMDESYREIQEELQKIYDTDEAEDVFDDVSDNEDTSDPEGTILYSVNDGDIEGDINTGGVVGTITDDPDKESDFEVVSGGQVGFRYERSKKAAVIHCRNNGDITVRNDYAGGIVGRADLGAVISSDNYGRIESLEGGYAGGIAGKSSFVIRGCRSKCEVVASKNAGGIAGIFHSGVGNICLSAVEEGEFAGAVAGDRDDRDEKQEDRGTVSGNIFVYRGLGAINGVTDENEARAVTYGELLRMDDIPPEFGNMTVTFKAEGKTVKKLTVPYGGEVSPENYPLIGNEKKDPGKPLLYAGENQEGQFGLWEDKDLSKIEQNITVNAVFMDYVTSIASDSSEKPDMILSGRFFEGTRLRYSFEEGNGEKDRNGNEILGTISFSPENEYGIPENNGYTVRFHLKDPDPVYQVYGEDDGYRVRKEVKKDREYLVFKTMDPGNFRITVEKDKKIPFLITAGAAALILLLAGLAIRYFRNRKNKKGTEEIKEGKG